MPVENVIDRDAALRTKNLNNDLKDIYTFTMKHKKIRCANERKVALVPFCFFSSHYFSYLNFLFFTLFYLKKNGKTIFSFPSSLLLLSVAATPIMQLEESFFFKKKMKLTF
ncbi:hypothetical protein, unlikely [Trypanosoma brucei brucei TREU927]|uniref:Uncharacterized protein n=1 Tax=Trypanosoma brucei brucei (strain 927/4 GUTat10.1) TaxID=185431 RepID=Q38DD0_TRYB2|nr:hypothetical protein, unlikely [Trypanosoma brucei brucei TREU927]EAN77190.1 hypothetical protein, unlikely [Trypanosoma brucei brucei TREU927]